MDPAVVLAGTRLAVEPGDQAATTTAATVRNHDGFGQDGFGQVGFGTHQEALECCTLHREQALQCFAP